METLDIPFFIKGTRSTNKWQSSNQKVIDEKVQCSNGFKIIMEKQGENFLLFRLKCSNITRPNSALDKHTIFSLFLLGFQRQVFKHVKALLEKRLKY